MDLLSMLSSPEAQKFIRDHESDDETALVLKHRMILGLPTAVIAEQIGARRKARLKLPSWYETPGIVYPPAVNLEQASSQVAAQRRVDIAKKLIAKRGHCADFTGGFGVDTFYLSLIFDSVDYVEPDHNLLEIARHNHAVLGATNIRYVPSTAEEYLSNLPTCDLVFMDPSRRIKGKRTYSLTASTPNVVELQPAIHRRCKFLMLKASPLLDIALGLQQLADVKHVFASAIENEVREIVFFSEVTFDDEPLIHAINSRGGHDEELIFRYSTESEAIATFGEPSTWLYEPNAAILKAGAFKTVAKEFGLIKLHPNTHLYTSESLNRDFPGRIFRLEKALKIGDTRMRDFFPGGKANIISRNHPLSAMEIKKTSKLKDGGDHYLIAFSGMKKKYVFGAARVK